MRVWLEEKRHRSPAWSGRPGTAGSRDRVGEQPAEACVASADRAAERRWGRHDGDPAADRQRQADDLALAGALHGRGGRRPAARGDPTGRQAAADPGGDRGVVAMTLAGPPGEATHWTGRVMAKAAGVSHRSVQRIWAAHGLKPHRVKSFKLSNDPKFAAKVQDVVGLYVDPPEHALVLSVDEKSQIQALDRTQPGLPMKKGRCGTMTHDYKRHGTTTLFAALSVLEGRVLGQCMARHRHQEFIRFLNKINRETPADAELHLIVDNYATHKHPKVQAWLERHTRFHFHFTPTSASWLNAVEGFFAKLTRQRLKRGVFKGIVDLQAAINRYLAETNDNPKPFIWTADPHAIIEKVRRGKQALESIH